MDFKSIGKRIKEKRIEKSWTQEKLAEASGLSSIYIGMIERGEKLPKLETFIRIANSLSTTPNELLADVTDRGYEIRLSKYTEQIGKLDAKSQQQIYEIIDAYLRFK